MSAPHSTMDNQQETSSNDPSHVQSAPVDVAKGVEEQEQQDKEEEGNSTQGSIIVHSTPDKDRDFQEHTLGSPSRTGSSSVVLGANKATLPDSPDTPKSTISQGGPDSSFESSFEIISGTQSPIWSSNPSSRVVSGSSFGGISNSASDTSAYSNPSITKITLTAPGTTAAPSATSASSQALRPRPFAGIIPRHPSTAPRSASAQHLKVNVQSESPPADTRQRAVSETSSAKVRARTSLSPMLSPIPDIAQDSIEGGLASLALDPKASKFVLPPPGRPEAIPEHASFAYIVKYGKNSIGDLTKEARKALGNLGLKSIPAMQGPLSLPYARCPSGIDAFLFSADKEEDPWTFLMDDDKPTRRPRQAHGFRINQVPLPGNSRYSQPSQIREGRLPGRFVSANSHDAGRVPQGHGYPQHRRVRSKKSLSKSSLFAGAQALEPEPEVQTPSTTSVEPMLPMQQAQLEGASTGYVWPQEYDAYAQAYGAAATAPPQPAPASAPYHMPMPNPHQPSPYQPSPYQAAPSHYPSPFPSPSQWPYPHPAFPFPTAAEFMQSLPPQHSYAHARTHSQPQAPPTMTAPYGYPPPSQTRPPLLDPAIVSYGKEKERRGSRGDHSVATHDTTYYTAPSEGESMDTVISSEEDYEEPQHGGFFFPAVPPADHKPSPARRRRASTVSTVTSPPPAPRRSSIGLPPVVPLVAERRNSAAPSIPHAGARKMSSAPAVSVAPRRSSVAPQTRLVKDSHLTQSYSFGSGGVSTSSAQHHQHGGAKATRQPRAAPPVLPASPPRIPLVPNHARSHINAAAPPPPSQMPASSSRRNSRVQVQMENQSTFATVVKDGGFGSRRGSNASAGAGRGRAHESSAGGGQGSSATAAGDSDGSRAGGWRKRRGGAGSRKKKSGSGASVIA